MSRGSLIATVDIRQAYTPIGLGFARNGLAQQIVHGCSLPFGLQSVPKIFAAVTNEVTWILLQQGVKFIIHYFDDFLLIGPPRCDNCAVALAILHQSPLAAGGMGEVGGSHGMLNLSGF